MLPAFQTLLQGLFSLLSTLRSSSTADPVDCQALACVIEDVCSGCCGGLDIGSVENEYRETFSTEDQSSLIRAAVSLEALCKCLEDCTIDARLWLFQHSLEV